MKTGKLDSGLLEEMVFKHFKYRRPEVITDPESVKIALWWISRIRLRIVNRPYNGAVADIGRLAVQISCNDIASNGVEPLGILLACMLPEGTTVEEIDEIMRQAAETGEALGVMIIGGHTEITKAVNTPVIVSTALGRTVKGKSQSATNMRPGDWILITKQGGLEGTGIIASDHESRLKDILTDEEISEAKAMLDQVSVVKEGVIAGRIGTAGMHDITEGEYWVPSGNM